MERLPLHNLSLRPDVAESMQQRSEVLFKFYLVHVCGDLLMCNIQFHPLNEGTANYDFPCLLEK